LKFTRQLFPRFLNFSLGVLNQFHVSRQSKKATHEIFPPWKYDEKKSKWSLQSTDAIMSEKLPLMKPSRMRVAESAHSQAAEEKERERERNNK
jgi:hypothetical protein